MATTTNYSWTTPDDTALVKDGAAAIRSLGTAIDTTVFTNAGAAINKTIIDAAGDLIYGTAADTAARLAIGTAGKVLTVNSGANAPEWATLPAAGGMTLLETLTLSGASTTSSSIPGTYKNLQIVVRNAKPASDGSYLYMRLNGDSSANRYRHVGTKSGTNFDFNATQWEIGPARDNSVSEGLEIINIFDYANTTTWKHAQSISLVNNETTTANYNYYGAYYQHYNQTAAITTITLFFNTGNITSGTALIYGVS